MSREIELAACPFCGGSATYNFSQKKVNDGTFWYWIECRACQACGKQSPGSKDQDAESTWARNQWNTHAALSEQSAPGQGEAVLPKKEVQPTEPAQQVGGGTA